MTKIPVGFKIGHLSLQHQTATIARYSNQSTVGEKPATFHHRQAAFHLCAGRLDLHIEQSYILLSTVHISFHGASLRLPARVGKLEDEQVRNEKPLDQTRIDVEQRADGGRLELRRFSVAIQGRSIAV